MIRSIEFLLVDISSTSVLTFYMAPLALVECAAIQSTSTLITSATGESEST